MKRTYNQAFSEHGGARNPFDDVQSFKTRRGEDGELLFMSNHLGMND